MVFEGIYEEKWIFIGYLGEFVLEILVVVLV